MISPPRLRSGVSCRSLAVIASADFQELVTMHSPDSRSTSVESPMQSSMAVTAGITSSRT